MDIGPLDRRIEIQQKAVVLDSVYGTETIAWIPLASIWANVQDAMPSKQETVVEDGLSLKTGRTRIRFRYDFSITPDCRIVIRQPYVRTLQIVGGPAEIGGRRAFMEILCEEFTS